MRLLTTTMLVALLFSSNVLMASPFSKRLTTSQRPSIPFIRPPVQKCGTITTVAGNGEAATPSDQAMDGQLATQTRMNPHDVAFDHSGNVYVIDRIKSYTKIRKISTDGRVTTIAGRDPTPEEELQEEATGAYPFSDDGSPAIESLFYAYGIALDSAGNVYFSLPLVNRIVKINSSGNLSTVGGTGEYGTSGDGAAAVSAQIEDPGRLHFDAADHLLFVQRGSIRRIDKGGIIDTVVTKQEIMDSLGSGFADFRFANFAIGRSGELYILSFIGGIYPGMLVAYENSNATLLFSDHADYPRLIHPLTSDRFGNPFIAFLGEVIEPTWKSYFGIGWISEDGGLNPFAGKLGGSMEDGVSATEVQFAQITNLAFDGKDNLYISTMGSVNNSGQNRLRKISCVSSPSLSPSVKIPVEIPEFKSPLPSIRQPLRQ